MEGTTRECGVFQEPKEKNSLSNYLSLLTRATSETDDQTPGYMYAEIEKITYSNCSLCAQLVKFLNSKLEKPSPVVKLKVLKIISHLVHNGHANFRNNLRENDASLKMATTYSGPPDPLLSTSLYEEIRKLSKYILNLLFDSTSMQNDLTFDTAKVPLQLGALGSSCVFQGKYEGFGNSPNDKEETIKGKVIDILDKLMYPVDEKAEVIKLALTGNSGDYKPVNAQDLTLKEFFKPQIQEISRTVRVTENNVKEHDPFALSETVANTLLSRVAPYQVLFVHVPGRAAGGWESDNDEESEKHPENSECEQYPENSECELTAAKSESNISSDSLERIELSNDTISSEQQIILEFCNKESAPNSVLDLNDLCKGLSPSSHTGVLETVTDALQMSLTTGVEKNNFKILRALLLVEWLLRNDATLVPSINQLISQQLNEIMNLDDKFHPVVKQKAQKINLIIEKLQLVKV